MGLWLQNHLHVPHPHLGHKAENKAAKASEKSDNFVRSTYDKAADTAQARPPVPALVATSLLTSALAVLSLRVPECCVPELPWRVEWRHGNFGPRMAAGSAWSM